MKATKIRLVHVMLCTFLAVTGCGMGNTGGNNQSAPSPPENGTARQHPGPTQPERVTFPRKVTDTKKAKQPVMEINGYLEPATPKVDRRIAKSTAPYLTHLSPFSYRVRADGSMIPPKDEPALSALRRTKVVPMMVITNFEEGNFSPEIARSVFRNPQARERLIRNVINTLEKKGYYALNIDFEHIKPADKAGYNDFLREIAPRVRRAGHPVSTALAPKINAKQSGGWHGAHDYAVHGKVVDFVILMTYEWGWTGGPPMPVAPIPKVRQVLDYATSVIPPEKIMMGAPLYGYDWTVPYRKGTNAKKMSPVQASALAKREGADIHYDKKNQAPWFRYTDDQDREHIVWFENGPSAHAKINLAQRYGLRGISYWVLGDDFPRNWELVKEHFQIRKYK
ncbi:glycosyl hydrolase family 18 protein [Salinithrix halophila]|uniref:Glycosyl hydrolase family 18 protein n=1 Tax=Salinithrix halophila TaxID=1485204 RepID=A0ABV8JGF8_9BACL